MDENHAPKRRRKALRIECGPAVNPPTRRRRKRRRARRIKIHIRWQRFLPIMFCMLLFLYGTVNLASYAAASFSAQQTNKQLQQIYEAETDEPAQEDSFILTQRMMQEAESEVMPTIAPEREAEPAADDVQPAVFHPTGAQMLPEMRELYAQNKDVVGWVSIEGVLSLPVVYRNNAYYLTHDFYGKKNDSGTVFLDAYHPMKPDTQYLVLHGHNRRDGSMFAMLVHYRALDFIHAHGVIDFSTLYQKEKYVVFAVLYVPEDFHEQGYVAFTGTPTFQSEIQFEDFIEKLQKNSLYRIAVNIEPTDALLTLSTCWQEGRLIVVGRRLREGETEREMRNKLSQCVQQ